ncbi:MAG: hypothetical protein ACI31G_00860 [Bacilli bacterium]
MVVLRAIGNFFVRIGRWIRDTAWVQPLLIVGGIFAIVFSIPYITRWVQSWYASGAEDVTYYNKFKLSLDGCDEQKSKADQLLQYLEDYSNDTQTEEQTKKYGEKFFVAFVQEDCASCEANYYGFEYLQKNWNKSGYEIDDGNKFGLFTIFLDSENDDGDNLFQKYFYDTHSFVFEESAQSAEESYYYVNQNGSSGSYASELRNLEDSDSFASPTVFLVDLTDDSTSYTNKYGVSEVFFAYEGTAKGGASTSTSQAKAQTLCDAWNHKGIFGDNYKG